MTSAKNSETLSKAVASLPPEQMFELMKQMKLCIQNNPVEAKQMLLQNSQLAYALLQAQVVMRIVNPHTAMSLLETHAKDPKAFETVTSTEPTSSLDAPAKPSVAQAAPTVAVNTASNTNRANSNSLSVDDIPKSSASNNTQLNSVKPASFGKDIDMRLPPTNKVLDEDLRIPPSRISTINRDEAPNNPFVGASDTTQQQQIRTSMNANTSAHYTTPGFSANDAVYSVPPPPISSLSSTQPQTSTSSKQQTTTAKSGPDSEKAALIMQVLQLTDQQINALPVEQRQSIIALKEQIANLR